MTLYKVLGLHAEPIHGGHGTWHLPTGKRPGKWMDEIKNPRCCNTGYHLVDLYSLAEWLAADCTIYVAEGKGSSHSDGSGKTACAQARLIRRVEISECDLRLFAADCAEHVLPIFHKVLPQDDRPEKAIEAARRFARGEIDAAARAAARAAAWDAAGAAAGAAARAAARAAAWDAASTAGAAAGAAARAAARAAAWDAEREWQATILATYLKEA
jgi:hypothetical protein